MCVKSFILQDAADALRRDPNSIIVKPAQYNTLKEFTETELVKKDLPLMYWKHNFKVIYGPVRVGAIDRIRMDTFNKSKYLTPFFRWMFFYLYYYFQACMETLK